MENTERLKEMLEPIINDNGCRLYELKWENVGKDHTLRVAIMKEDGSMDLDTCALISDALSLELDAKEVIRSAYTLEVCSPGAEREIKDLSELVGIENPYIFVRLIHPFKKMKEITGTLLSYDDGMMRLEYRDKAAKRVAEFLDSEIEFIRYAVKI